MKKYNNKKGFSIIFGMGIVLATSLTVIYLLEYVMPFSKDTKGIEFSSNAYYQSSSAVEDALLFVSKNNLGDSDSDPLSLEPDALNPEGKQSDMGYDIVARGDMIPPIGKGNSEFDPDWNILSIGEPIQLEIGGDHWDTGNIVIRVPNTGIGENVRLQTQTGGIIAWQLSSENETLSSRDVGNQLQEALLKTGVEQEFNILNSNGKTLENSDSNFQSFYNSQCSNANDLCTLKISIINALRLQNTEETPIPYLEYRIVGASDIPLRYTRIGASGISQDFKKDLDIKVPQQTVNEAFDFTVFQ